VKRNATDVGVLLVFPSSEHHFDDYPCVRIICSSWATSPRVAPKWRVERPTKARPHRADHGAPRIRITAVPTAP